MEGLVTTMPPEARLDHRFKRPVMGIELKGKRKGYMFIILGFVLLTIVDGIGMELGGLLHGKGPHQQRRRHCIYRETEMVVNSLILLIKYSNYHTCVLFVFPTS